MAVLSGALKENNAMATVLLNINTTYFTVITDNCVGKRGHDLILLRCLIHFLIHLDITELHVARVYHNHNTFASFFQQDNKFYASRKTLDSYLFFR